MPVFQTGRDDQALLDFYNAATGGAITPPARPPAPARDPFYGAVDDWTSQRTPTPTRSTGNQRPINDGVQAPAGYYPQPEQYYAPQQPAQRPASRPVQGPAPRPVEPPRSTYSVDPLEAAINTWRNSNQSRLPPSQYEVEQPTFDYEPQRPDTGPSQFTAQQYKPPTVQSRSAPAYDPNAPEQQPQGVNAWLPQGFGFARPVAATMAANSIRDPEQRSMWGNVLNTAWQGVKDEVGDSAAYERMQFGEEERAKNYAERGGAAGLGDVWDATKEAGAAIWRNAMLPYANYFEEKPLRRYDKPQTNTEVALGEATTIFRPLMEAANTNKPTAKLAQKAQDVLGYAALPFDYATTGIDIADEMPAAPWLAAGLDTAGRNLQAFYEDPGAVLSGQSEEYKYFTDFISGWMEQAQQYKAAVTPTPEQIATNTPGALAQNRDRSWLNSLGGLDATEATYDALNDRAATVDTLNQQANAAWEAGAMTEDEAKRQEYWAEAAQAGSDAWVLANSHPQQIVNENTNILRQLLTEVALPDVTDLLGGLFQLAELTPAARRLTRVTNEVMTPTQRVVNALDEMVMTADNAGTIAKQRSSYNKAWNLWSTGQSRAHIATDQMQRYVVNLISDVETPRDAVILMQQLAADPRKLITGVDASLLQSPGLLARAGDDGLVRFGTMGLDRVKEPLRIYQQALQDVMASPALRENALLNKADFMTDFTDSMNSAGYRWYNVATDAADVPAGTAAGRIQSVGKGEYVVEFRDAKKAIVGTSEVMGVSEARKLKKAIGSGGQAQKSFIGEISQFQRSLVSPFYILTTPGTWDTNLIGGIATAAGDGMVSLRSSRFIDDWTARLFGVDPTQRGLRNVESAGSSAAQFSDKGPLKFLKRAYGQIDEQVGKRVFYKGATDALRKTGGEVLNNTLSPILLAAGVDPTEAKRLISHLHEVGMQGGDLTGEFNKLLNGQTRVFSLSEVNPTWLEAVPPDSLSELYGIIRSGASRDDVLQKLEGWSDRAVDYWDELIASAPPPPQRYTWQRLEVTQDSADIQQAAAMAQKYGGVAAEEAQVAAKSLADGMTESQRRLQTLTQMVTDAADPQNRYALYNVWGQVTDYTANVRAKLAELAEQANTVPAPQKQVAWQNYWGEAQRLWTDRNAHVNQLLEQSTAAMSRGDNFTPRLNTWDILERTGRIEEEKLWQTLRMEPQSGRYDARLQQVIEAGRSISDKSIARTYAAARRFLEVDAMDFIVSAEHNVQIAGAQVSAMLRKARETAAKSGKWEDYFGIRNESWRQLRQYEQQAWENATRSIVRDGLGKEATTGLRFDAGPDGIVELVGPRTEAGQATSRLGRQVERTTTERTVWDVRREDGTVTQLSDNYIPDDLKAKYNGVTDGDITDGVELELDNIASAYPYADDAQRALEARGRADELMDLMMEDTGSGIDIPFPGSKALDEEVGLRAERAGINTTEARNARVEIRNAWDAGEARRTRRQSIALQDTAQPATYTFVDNDGLYPSGTAPDITPEIPIPPRENRPKPIYAGDTMMQFANEADKELYIAGGAASSKAAKNARSRLLASGQYKDFDELQQAAQAYKKEVLQYKRRVAPNAITQSSPGGAEIVEIPARGTPSKPDMRTYESSVVSADFEAIAKRFGIDIGGLKGKTVAEVAEDVTARTTAAGGMHAGELGHGAAYAKQQLENILGYVTDNLDEIIQPKGRLIGEGSNLAALQEFRTKVLPAWDNVKYAASEYGNRMRSFTMVDFANNTRLDELLGLYMPYGFWMTRTVKNSAERAIFEPQIWRRVMQAEREMRAIQEQEGAPQRYEGTVPVDMGNGTQYWLRILPSKWWPTAGLFTMNDYADPESANSAFGFASESLRAANLQGYPWWDAAVKAWEGKTGDIYPANYLPQGRIASDIAVNLFGADAASRWTVPGYFENSVARTLNNMAIKGDITRDQARWAHDYLWQLKNGGEPLPDSLTGAYDPKEIEPILDQAMRDTAGIDLISAVTSYLTGVSVRQFDQSELEWTGAAQDYRDFKYGPDNPYGSKLAADSVKPDAQLAWSKAGVWRPEEQRPGVSMATDAKSAEKDAINQTLMDATDEFITNYDGTPANFEISDFKDAWMAEQMGGDPSAYYVENMSNHLDEKYPSATTFDGEGFQYDGYAPEEVRQKVRVAAYYKAKEELEPPTYPEYPGDTANRADKNAYFAAKKVYDADKLAYDQALEELTDQYLADPRVLRELTGRYQLNPSNPGLVNDFARSLPKDTEDIFGYPVRPTGDAAAPFDSGLTPLAGDPEDAAAIIEQEKTKYMSDLEKETRAANTAKASSSKGKGYSSGKGGGYSSSYRPYRRSSSGGGYRRSGGYGGGGGGGGAGGNYYVDPVYAREFPSWLMEDPKFTGYRGPDRNPMQQVNVGPDPIRAWKPLSW